MATIDLEVFFLAARTGNVSLLKYCLENGVDVHSCDDFAIRLAAETGQTDAITLLLKNGANEQALDETMLRLSALRGETNRVRKILAKDSCSYQSKQYAMYNAVLSGHVDIAELLLDNGISPYANDGAVLKVVRMCKHKGIIALFENYLN